MSSAADGAEWFRNVPIPEFHVGGLFAGGMLTIVRPWSLPSDGPIGFVTGSGLLVFGLVAVAWSVVVAGHRTLEAPTSLVVDGPYRFSRNPMYVGWTGIYLGISLLADAAWPLALLPLVVAAMHRQVRREEVALERRFGDEYRRYRRGVRRYL